MQHRWKEQITSNPDVLTPVRYVGAQELDDDSKSFDEEMQRLVAQFAESAKLKQPIRANPKGPGYAA